VVSVVERIAWGEVEETPRERGRRIFFVSS